MIGFVINHQFFQAFADYLLKFGYVNQTPVCAVSMQNLKKCFGGSPLFADIWNGGTLEKDVQIEIPTFLDSGGNVFSEKNAEYFDAGFLNWLHDQTTVLTQKSLAKESLAHALLSCDLSLYAIPTWHVSTFSELLNRMQAINRGFLKPISGRKGLGTCKIWSDNRPHFTIRNIDGTFKLTEEWFLTYLARNEKDGLGSSVLLQPCLDFSLDESHAIDFRLLRHRGKNGVWEEVATYARIGATNLVSNVSQGGFIGDPRETLSVIAGDQADSLFDEIMFLGEAIPKLIQRFRGDSVFCLGLDVAVDRSTLRPYILEANTYPGTKYFTCQLAEKRVQYYQYLLEQQQ